MTFYEPVNVDEYFLLVRIESIQALLPLKDVLLLIKWLRLLLSKNVFREESPGSILKSPVTK